MIRSWHSAYDRVVPEHADWLRRGDSVMFEGDGQSVSISGNRGACQVIQMRWGRLIRIATPVARGRR